MKLTAIPPFLYHGTSSLYLDAITNDSLQSRNVTQVSQWEDNPSREDAIYLTNAYPLHYAANAQTAESDAIIFEIDTSILDLSLFCSDEDALTLTSNTPRSEPLEIAGPKNKAQMHEYSALDSLNALGTCAYLGPIPPEAITRYVRLSLEDVCELISAGLDPIISPLNYKYIGSMYRESIKWLFNEPFDSTRLENFTPHNFKVVSLRR